MSTRFVYATQTLAVGSHLDTRGRRARTWAECRYFVGRPVQIGISAVAGAKQERRPSQTTDVIASEATGEIREKRRDSQTKNVDAVSETIVE